MIHIYDERLLPVFWGIVYVPSIEACRALRVGPDLTGVVL
jgi:hypothetical protein